MKYEAYPGVRRVLTALRFRWASMQFPILTRLKLEADIRERLDEMPPGLIPIYDEIYKRFFDDNAAAGKRIIENTFAWLSAPTWPLRTTQFLGFVALGVPLNESLTVDRVVSLCCNFVLHDETSDVFRFAHPSVPEYLTSSGRLSTEAANGMVAYTCLMTIIGGSKALSARNFMATQTDKWKHSQARKPIDVRKLNNLELYAVRFWTQHCAAATEQRKEEPLKPALEFMLSDYSEESSPLSLWIRSPRHGMENPLSWFDLHICLQNESDPQAQAYLVACSMGLTEILDTKFKELQLDEETRVLGLILNAYHHHYGALSHLLGSGRPLDITEELLLRAFRSNGGNVQFLKLLVQRASNASITDSVIAAAVEHADALTMELLFQKRGAHNLTEELILDFVGRAPNNLLPVLFRVRPETIVCERMLVGVVGNWDYRNSNEKLHYLIKQGGVVTQAVLDELAGTATIHRLNDLDDMGIPFTVTPKMMANAARGGNFQLMEDLLDHDGGVVTEDLVLSAAGHPIGESTEAMMKLILDRSHQIRISEEMILRVVGAGAAGTLELFLARSPEARVHVRLRDVARRPYAGKLIKVALKYTEEARIGKDVIMAIQDNGGLRAIMESGKELEMTTDAIAYLLRHMKPAEPMPQVLELYATTKMVDDLMLAAASNWRADHMLELLAMQCQVQSINAKVYRAAAANPHRGKDALALLVRLFGQFDASDEILTATVRWGHGEVLQDLLDRRPDFPLTQGLLELAAAQTDDGLSVIKVLLRRNTNLKITEAVLMAAAGDGFVGNTLKFLLRHPACRDVRISEDMICSAARHKHLWCGDRNIKILLRHAGVPFTESTVIEAIRDPKKAGTLLLGTKQMTSKS